MAAQRPTAAVSREWEHTRNRRDAQRRRHSILNFDLNVSFYLVCSLNNLNIPFPIDGRALGSSARSRGARRENKERLCSTRYCNEARPKERSDRGHFLPLGKNPLHNEASPRERNDRGRFLSLARKASSYRGSYRVPLFNYLSVCLSVDCGSCTRPISTNPVSMEAGEYGLTRGTWFFARRLELVAVAGLLWISWCVLDGANFS